MFKSLSPEQRETWKQKIDQQKSSGQPISQWCKANGITIGQFYYWREQFSLPVQRSEFIELKSPKKAGIRVECNGVFIDLEPHFDSSTLKRCITLLRELSC